MGKQGWGQFDYLRKWHGNQQIRQILREHGTLAYSEFFDHLKISRSNLSVILKRLVKAGHLERIEVMEDLRRTLYSLTRVGEKVVELDDEIHDLYRHIADLKEITLITSNPDFHEEAKKA